jgi:hypothetical protein
MSPDPGYVPGLTRPISVSEYAQLEGVREAEVFAAIRALTIPSAFSRGQWYVEAPPNCEARGLLNCAVTKRDRRRKADWSIGFGGWRMQASARSLIYNLNVSRV